jgi:shikimate dehydrogenase
MPGSGKTSLGRSAAERLRVPFADVDEEVEKRLGMTIRRVFEERGEIFFRDAESAALRDALLSPETSVIAPGGGAILRPGNVSAMRDRGVVIFLDRPSELIAKSVPDDGSRPLLTDTGKLYELERERRALYVDAADYTLQNDGGEEEAVELLLRVIGKSDSGPEYAVIGDPIAHSLSPAIHEAVFETLGIFGRYRAIRVPGGAREKLADFFGAAKDGGMRGFNVTRPHKLAIIPFLDALSEDAKLCGAVNTVVFRGGRGCGHNTDMEGLLFSLREQGSGYAGRRVVVLGAGGASRGVALKAAQEGAEGIVILARDVRKAEDIASALCVTAAGRARAMPMTAPAMREAAVGADLLVNATPLGMSGAGSDFTSLGFLEALPQGAFVCDLVYDPPLTPLLARASELGLRSQNGLGMLIYQAILADELFLGRTLDRAKLYKAVRDRLA